MAKDNRIIHRGVSIGGKTFLPDQEDELAAAATPQQLERLKAKGAIEGDWETEISDGQRMSGDGLEAQMLRILIGHVGERGHAEDGAVGVLQRIINERDTFETAHKVLSEANDELKSINEKHRVIFEQLDAKIAALEADVESKKTDALEAMALVAKMHEAAVGEVRGPLRGIVEDVADVRERAEKAEKRLADIEVANLESAKNEMAENSAKPLAPRVLAELRKAGFDTPEKVKAAPDAELLDLWGVNETTLPQVRALHEI